MPHSRPLANIPCPFLGRAARPARCRTWAKTEVVLSIGRLGHILDHHPDFEDVPLEQLCQVVTEPDQVREDPETGALKFVRGYDAEHLVVVVSVRAVAQIWTAYFKPRLSAKDVILWQR
jgi:hypothetical protein